MFAHMQMNELILPPNVNGCCRGQLNVYLKEINWKGNVVNAFYGIRVKFIWWGENKHTAATLCLTNKKSKPNENVLKYSILTRLKLFKHYLLSSEPIEIEFSSTTTSYPIGKASVRIPKDLINYLQGTSKIESCSFVNVNQRIVNSQNKCVGDISLGFELIDRKSGPTNMVMPSVVNKPGVQHKGEKESRSSEYTKSIGSPSNGTGPSSLLNYLTGQRLTKDEENNALQEIRQTSPSESIVNDLTEEVRTIVSMAARTKEAFLSPTNDENQFMKIFLHDMTLTESGLHEILNTKDYSDTNFVIESILDSPLIKRRRSVKRLQIPLSFDFGSRIDLNQELIQPICMPANDAQFSLSAITIIFWCKSSKKSKIFGTVFIDFDSFITSDSFKLSKNVAVKSSENNDILATLSLSIEIVADASADKHSQWSLTSDGYSDPSERQSESIRCCREKQLNNLVYGTSIYDAPKDNSSTGSGSMPSNDNNRNQNDRFEFNDESMTSSQCETHQSKLGENDEQNIEPAKDLHGLFYAGLINFDRRTPRNVDTFLLCRRFWDNSGMFTNYFRGNVINFLEEFPVYCDVNFLERTNQSSMIVEIWQKEENQLEKLIGLISIPLHQFYIAFSNVSVMNHVSKQQLPVVSIDGWSTMTAPETSTPIGTLQVILAVGSCDQINYLKNRRNLTPCSKFLYPPLPHLPIASKSAIMSTSLTGSLADNRSESQSSDGSFQSERMLRFSSFLDKLAQSLPVKNSSTTSQLDSPNCKSTENQRNNGPSQSRQIRSTSDLLDQLQHALSVPPPSKKADVPNCTHPNSEAESSNSDHLQNTRCFYAEVKIENAKNLPPVVLTRSTSGSEQNSKLTQGQQDCMRNEINPSTYVTFKAIIPSTGNIECCENFTYATNVVENSRSPQWNKNFQVYLPAELLNDSSKRFMMTIWRKASPAEDIGIGTVSIDLTVLMNGTPSINKWFSVVDFMGNECGRILVNVTPLEDIKVHRKILQAVLPSAAANETEPIIEQPPSVQNSNDMGIDGGLLSRVLKRKFTELEEISQRLRSRLLDVNDLPIELDDEFDEFENDLNTVPYDDSNLYEENEENWLEFCQFESENQSKEDTVSMPGPSTQNTRKTIDTDLFRLNIQEIESDYTKERISELLYSAVSRISTDDQSMQDKTSEHEQVTGISKALTKTTISDKPTDDDPMTTDREIN